MQIWQCRKCETKVRSNGMPNTKTQNNSYIHLFLALTKYAQQECKFFNTSKKLKSANASALRVKCTFFNAFSPLKFAIVSLYLISTLFFSP